jgi:hypothetical protein
MIKGPEQANLKNVEKVMISPGLEPETFSVLD